MRKSLAILTFMLASVAISASAQAAPKIVAVFNIEDRSGRFDQQACGQLTEYLAAQLAKGATFRVVPQAELRARLKAKKKESYKKCVAEQCQIAIGRELAAQKSLATRIVKIGTKCAVMSTLYDLKTSASEHAATAKAACNQDALVTALENVAKELRGSQQSGGAGAVTPVKPAPDPQPKPKAVEPGADGPVTPPADRPAPPVDQPTASKGTPWYGSWWFWTLTAVVIAGVVVGVVVATSGSSDESSGTFGLRRQPLGQPLFRF